MHLLRRLSLFSPGTMQPINIAAGGRHRDLAGLQAYRLLLSRQLGRLSVTALQRCNEPMVLPARVACRM